MRLPIRPVVFALALLAGAAPLSAQQRERPREPRGFDFTPDGVWRGRARQIRSARMAGLNAAAINAAPVISGQLHMPVMLVSFRNTDPTVLRAGTEYDNALASPSPAGQAYTLRTFYEEMSGGMFSVRPAVLGWMAADSNDTFYEGNGNGLDGSGRIPQLIQQTVLRQDASVDFGQFDNNGPDGVPNSLDDDGFVDIIAIVHPELGGECGGSGNRNIWAHRFFVTGWGQASIATNDLRPNGTPIRVNNYIIQGGVGGSTACDGSAIMAPGTIAHELGHGLGLPDFYDTDPSDEDDSEGIGWWGLMGAGNYARPNSPAYMEGFSRMTLGWVTVRDVTANSVITLGPYAAGDTILRLRPTGPNQRGEYYLIENRQAAFSDTALIGRTGPGLLVWHIDSTQYENNRSGNGVNTGPIHGLALEQADGIGNLRSSTAGIVNRGDAGDPFPGASGRTALTFNGTPGMRLNSGGFPGFVIDSISQVTPGGEMRLRVVFGGLTVVRGADTTATVRVRGTAYNVFRDLFATGDTVSVSADSLHLSGDGRRQFTFVSWSNGQSRSHLFNPSSGGGTLTANFTRRFRYDFGAAGGGDLTASPATASGTFVTEGDSVVLTIQPAAGQSFTGWSGDTSGTATTMVLRSTRPWAVTANFIALLAVADTALHQPLMGAAYLDTLRMAGGTGLRTFALVGGTGTLPPGLTMTTAGIISGTPTRDSSYAFTVRVTSGAQQSELALRLTVVAPSLALDDVVGQLLDGGSRLSAERIGYLDLQGNVNGQLDVGDLAAWLDRTGQTLSPAVMARIMARRKQ